MEQFYYIIESTLFQYVLKIEIGAFYTAGVEHCDNVLLYFALLLFID